MSFYKYLNFCQFSFFFKSYSDQMTIYISLIFSFISNFCIGDLHSLISFVLFMYSSVHETFLIFFYSSFNFIINIFFFIFYLLIRYLFDQLKGFFLSQWHQIFLWFLCNIPCSFTAVWKFRKSFFSIKNSLIKHCLFQRFTNTLE